MTKTEADDFLLVQAWLAFRGLVGNSRLSQLRQQNDALASLVVKELERLRQGVELQARSQAGF